MTDKEGLGVKLTKAVRDDLDAKVLQAAAEWTPNATYVLRNRISRQQRGSTLTTAAVLRSCRRLEKAGLLQEYKKSGYAVMLVWELTTAGRQALSEHPQ